MPEPDSRYILRLGVRGDKAFGMVKDLARSAGLRRERPTGFVSPDDLRRDADGEVVFDLSGFSFLSSCAGFTGDAAGKARRRIADRLLMAVRHGLCSALGRKWEDFALAAWPVARLRKSTCAGVMVDGAFPLRECLCLVEAIKGADRSALVKAYGEATVCAVCGAPADPMALAMIESIRRHIYALRERQREERLALRERHCAEVRRMDARHDAEVAEAEASLRRLHGGGSDFECFA